MRVSAKNTFVSETADRNSHSKTVHKYSFMKARNLSQTVRVQLGNTVEWPLIFGETSGPRLMFLREIRRKIMFLKILKRKNKRVQSESKLFPLQTLLETSFSHILE